MDRLSLGKLLMLICLSLLVGAALSGCGPTATPTTEPESTAVCTPDDHVQPKTDDLAWCPTWDAQLPVGEFEYRQGHPVYVKNQVIVTGRAGDVRAVVNEVLDARDEPQKSIVLDWIPDAALDRFPNGTGDPVVIEIYPTGSMTAEEAVRAVYSEAYDQQLAVFADLNFVTGHPHIVAGSPHIVAGSDVGVAGEAKRAFWEQWAFKDTPGIGLTTLGLDPSTITSGGPGVRIGVFDTSPFEDPGAWEIAWITPTLKLCVSHMLTPTQYLTPTADHGLFVAGLTHAVAPTSEIHLIQVLDENALGVLGTLNTALDLFIRERSQEQGGSGYLDTLTNTVVNLSLGFPGPRHVADYGLDGLLDSHNRLTEKLEQQSKSPWQYWHDELPVVSLETMLIGASSRGVTVVAAAGNESGPQQLAPSEVPAAYPSVIGVAASNRHGRRACFSNQGDVAAPGGDTSIEKGKCAKRLDTDCESCIIGPVVNTSPCSGYAYWVGTSFSAPLVSGQAAVLIEQGGGLVAPEVVSATIGSSLAIPTDSDLVKGIINIPNSLQQ